MSTLIWYDVFSKLSPVSYTYLLFTSQIKEIVCSDPMQSTLPSADVSPRLVSIAQVTDYLTIPSPLPSPPGTVREADQQGASDSWGGGGGEEAEGTRVAQLTCAVIFSSPEGIFW